VLSAVAVFSGGNLSLGVREDRADRWVIVAFGLIGLLDAIVPMNSIGKLRATVTRATKTVEWVTSYVKIPATSSSSQRIALPIPPATHRRK
jgi:hypothetical protein